jgi:hypothetical protein
VITLDAKLARIPDGNSNTKDFIIAVTIGDIGFGRAAPVPRSDGEGFKSKPNGQRAAAHRDVLRTRKSKPDGDLRFASEITDAPVRG